MFEKGSNMMGTPILIADDDRDIAKLIEIYLNNEGFTVIKAHDGVEALTQLKLHPVELVILDIMMPKMDGLEVCRNIRETQDVPILMLSAKAEDIDKITGLMTGADDYMVKPFNPLELVARVKSILRRINSYRALGHEQESDTIHLQSLTINKATHTVMVDDRKINLTSTEFDILMLLASHPGRVFSAEEIFELVWKEKYFQSNNTVMVHISKLRDKLEKGMEGTKIIRTVWGVGYKVEQ